MTDFLYMLLPPPLRRALEAGEEPENAINLLIDWIFERHLHEFDPYIVGLNKACDTFVRLYYDYKRISDRYNLPLVDPYRILRSFSFLSMSDAVQFCYRWDFSEKHNERSEILPDLEEPAYDPFLTPSAPRTLRASAKKGS